MAVSALRRKPPGFGLAISLLTLVCQVQDPLFLRGGVWVIVWLGLALVHFALVARHRLILTPDGIDARISAQIAAGAVPQ